jgi:hypothetical protein
LSGVIKHIHLTKPLPLRERSDLTIYGDWNPMIKSFETSRGYFERHEDYLGISFIPRRTGGVENPQGGVRHAIPGKGYY